MSAVSTTEIGQRRGEMDPLVAAATAGDESAFSKLVDRHRRELQAHTYRILGSYEDSEDLTQETFLRAWRMRGTFQGRSSFRAWLYRIATNTCLSALERRPRRRQPAPGDDLALQGIASADPEPDAELVAKETIELAFLVAVQHLPPKQRAVLIARDVLGWPAKETAALLGTTVPAINSALHRARATLREHLAGPRLEWAPGSAPSEEERALLRRYLDAAVRADENALVDVMREDAGLPAAGAASAAGTDVAWDCGA
jgi:RNA polymerase sigma-70 factor (ECF subfamily)